MPQPYFSSRSWPNYLSSYIKMRALGDACRPYDFQVLLTSFFFAAKSRGMPIAMPGMFGIAYLGH